PEILELCVRVICIRHESPKHIGILVHRRVSEIEVASNPLRIDSMNDVENSFDRAGYAAVIFNRDSDAEIHRQGKHFLEGSDTTLNAFFAFFFKQKTAYEIHANDRHAKVTGGLELRDVRF